MSKRPSFQFYPGDWRNNAKLRRCSWAARGAWIEVMGLLHDSDFYGVLRWNLKEIAQAIGCPVSLIKELVEKGVLKGCDKGICDALVYIPKSGRMDGNPVSLVGEEQGPVWFSSRMVRDEHVRQNRGKGSRYESENASLSTSPNPSPKPPFGENKGDAPNPSPSRWQGDGSSSSSSINTNSISSSLSTISQNNSASAREKTTTNVNPTLSRVDNSTAAIADPILPRIGDLCKRFRVIGIRASPDVFKKPNWNAIFNRFDNDEIAAIAESKKAAMPEKSLSANYLIPVFEDMMKPKRENYHDERKRVADALTGRNRRAAEERRTVDTEANIVDVD